MDHCQEDAPMARLPSSTAHPMLVALVAAVAATAFATSALAAGQPIDDELEKYWNVELAVPSVTNPMHITKGAFEGTLALGFVPNDSYYTPLPVGVKAGYHMIETLSIELSFSYLHPFGSPEIAADDQAKEQPFGMSDLLYFLETAGKNGLLEGVRKPPRMSMMMSADIMYSPLHGKVGAFASKLASFDIGIALGAGMIAVDVDENPWQENDEVSTFAPAGHWGATLRFYMTQWLCLRADYRQFVYKPEEKGAVLFPVELTFGVSFLSN
jgi:outer membrane beta-barrel protein